MHIGVSQGTGWQDSRVEISSSMLFNEQFGPACLALQLHASKTIHQI